jgi:hypothetical protein
MAIFNSYVSLPEGNSIFQYKHVESYWATPIFPMEITMFHRASDDFGRHAEVAAPAPGQSLQQRCQHLGLPWATMGYPIFETKPCFCLKLIVYTWIYMVSIP